MKVLHIAVRIPGTEDDSLWLTASEARRLRSRLDREIKRCDRVYAQDHSRAPARMARHYEKAGIT